MPQFSIRYCSNGTDTNSSKSGFFVNFLQVYRICNEINSRCLPLWGFDNCEKQGHSKELNRIFMLEGCNFVLWKSLNLIDILQRIKVCSSESEFGHKEHVSSLFRLPCGTRFLREFNFANLRFFCVSPELIFAIERNWFLLLGINFCDFQEVAFYL